LINVVFLMLVFFMVAGTIAPPMERDLRLVRTSDLEGRAPPDTLVVHPDGRLTYRGEAIASAQAFLAARPEDARGEVRIVPDRALPAVIMVNLARDLRAAGASSVVIVTQRGLDGSP
jgi:biopolymer transport protein ExbD